MRTLQNFIKKDDNKGSEAVPPTDSPRGSGPAPEASTTGKKWFRKKQPGDETDKGTAEARDEAESDAVGGGATTDETEKKKKGWFGNRSEETTEAQLLAEEAQAKKKGQADRKDDELLVAMPDDPQLQQQQQPQKKKGLFGIGGGKKDDSQATTSTTAAEGSGAPPDEAQPKRRAGIFGGKKDESTAAAEASTDGGGTGSARVSDAPPDADRKKSGVGTGGTGGIFGLGRNKQQATPPIAGVSPSGPPTAAAADGEDIKVSPRALDSERSEDRKRGLFGRRDKGTSVVNPTADEDTLDGASADGKIAGSDPVDAASSPRTGKEKEGGGLFGRFGKKDKDKDGGSSSKDGKDAAAVKSADGAGGGSSSSAAKDLRESLLKRDDVLISAASIEIGGTKVSLPKEKLNKKKDKKKDKKKKNVELIVGGNRKTMYGIYGDGAFKISPEVMRVTPIGVERAANSRIQSDWAMFLSFGWRGVSAKGKKEKRDERKTPTKPKPWDFVDCEAFCFELPSAEASATDPPVFFIELWAYGRVYNTLEGSLDLSLEALKSMVGDVELQRDYWYTLSNDKGESVADVRIAFEFGRSDATVLLHFQQGLVRLASAERGDVKSTMLWPETDAPLAALKSSRRDTLQRRGRTGNRNAPPKLEAPKPNVGGGTGAEGYQSSSQSPRGSPSPASLSPRNPGAPHSPSDESPVKDEYESVIEHDVPDGTTGAAEDSSSSSKAKMAAQLLGLVEDSDDDSSDAPGPGVSPSPRVLEAEESGESAGYGNPFPDDRGFEMSAYSTPVHREDDGAASPSESPQPTPPTIHKPSLPKAIQKDQPTVVRSSSDIVFNEEWQQAVERLVNADSSKLPETYQSLSDLSRKFAAVAQTYGRIIIRELHLPEERKIIKPMSLGGIIGGDKYVVAGILFKVSRPGLFENDEPSAKVAGHELKALTALFNVNQIYKIGFALPMIAILDVLGHRVIALALCPLDHGTLIHGSADAGVTIFSGGEAEERLSIAAARLNLKLHQVKGHMIPLAVDCEVHSGKDGRMYLIDLSRVIPPEQPNREVKFSHLFRMLRPELVRNNPVPLCSDAASSFVARETDFKEHNTEIADATNRLKKLVIPWTALSLDGLHMARSDPEWRFFRLDHMHRILHLIHALGVNCRYLFDIRGFCRTPVSRQLVLVEAVARTVKKQARNLMREAVASSNGVHDVAATRSLVDYFNLLLSQGASREIDRQKLWDSVATDTQAYFGKIDTEGNRSWSGAELLQEMLNVPMGMLLLFSRVNEMLGLQWSPRVTQLVDECVSWLERQEQAEEEVNRSGLFGAVLDITRASATGIKGIGTGVVRGAGHLLRGHKRTVSNQGAAPKIDVADIPAPPPPDSGAAVAPPSPKVQPASQSPGTAPPPSLPAVSPATLAPTPTPAREMSPRSAGYVGATGGNSSSSTTSTTGSGSGASVLDSSSSSSIQQASLQRKHSNMSVVRDGKKDGSTKGASAAASAGSATSSDGKASSDDGSGGGKKEKDKDKTAEEVNPWTFWAKNSGTLFFEDDLVDIGFRVKLNNAAAMAQGFKLVKLSEETSDVNLKAHFRHLAGRFFNAALMSNPTNPITLRMQARILLEQEAFRLGVPDFTAPGAMAPHFWSSTLRYVDFLFKCALDSDQCDAQTLHSYAIFLRSGGQHKLKEGFLILRAVLADHEHEAAKERLAQHLHDLNLTKESNLFMLWRSTK